jgi:hypothetical protein
MNLQAKFISHMLKRPGLSGVQSTIPHCHGQRL